MVSHHLRLCLISVLLVTAAQRTSLANPPAWIELRSPNFIVITNANDKQAHRVAYQFEMIRAVFRQFFGISTSAKEPPLIIIAAKDEATLKTLLPEFWAKKGTTHPAGIYLGGPEKNYVGLRLDADMNQEAYEPFEPLYHEYVHYLTRRMMSRLPLWMVEGLAEFYGNTRLRGKMVYVGAPSSSNIRVLREKAMLPLSTLFAVDASSPYYHEEDKTSIFYAESWVLTHYLMTRDWREGTHRLSQFVALLGQNVPQEEAARRSIGEPAALQEALNLYVRDFAFTVGRLDAPAEVDESDFTPQPISEAESLAVRADFMVHDHHYAEAQEMLEESLKLDPKLAAAHESMGFLSDQQGKTEEAGKWYSQAVALNSQSYLANYYYAVNLLKDKPIGDSAGRAESSLRTALKINPDFAPAYDALAYLLMGRNQNLEEAHIMALHAVTLEPGNAHYRLRSAQVLERMGRTDDAVKLANLAAAMAKTPEEQAEALATLASARQFQAYQKQVQEQQESFQKAQTETAPKQASETKKSGQLDEPGSGDAPTSAARSPSPETNPPVLRRRDEATAANSRGLMPPVAPEHPQRPAVLPRRALVEGTVKDAKCYGTSTLEVTLDSSAGVMELYSDDYLHVEYSALNFIPKGILNPCIDMKGRHARITYHPAKGPPKQGQPAGEMAEVQLVK